MSDVKKDRSYHPDTRIIHGEFHFPQWDYANHIVPPISASSAYRLESASRGAEGFLQFANPELNRKSRHPIYIYDRLDEPSRSMLEQNLATAEGGETGVCFSTGMGAIAAALGVLVKTGDRIIAHHTLYGCTYSLLTNWWARFGVKTTLVDFRDLDQVRAALGRDVMAFYFETPTNPTMEIIDIAAVHALAEEVNQRRGPKRRRIFTVVDNTFATPFCQRPISLGADVVVSSLTKNIGGFGTDMGGVVVAPRLIEPDLLLFRKDFGAVLSPRSAWPTLVYGLPTLALRSNRQIRTALEVARFLEMQPQLERVIYPGLTSHPQHALAKTQMRDSDGNFAPGIMIAFVLKGSPLEARERGRKMMDWIASHSLAITLAVSLGQIRTLIEHPASMTHAVVPAEAQLEAGIEPGLIRISIGLEASQDIIGDLSEALAQSA